MPFLLQYLLKLSLTMALLYLFYYVLLRNLTFYKWNRFYLLCYSLLSFFIPFINITPWMPEQATVQPGFIEQVNMLSVLPASTAPHPLALFSSWSFLTALFVTGVLVMLARLAMQFLSIHNMKRRATLIQASHVRLYDVDSPISPFSFAHSVFINSRLHSEDDLKKIIQHEFVHVKQQHTIDLLAGELLCIVNWYNPFAWLIRKAIRQNLEFIADDTVLQSGVDAGQYQYLLLKVTGMPQYSVSSNFNISSLKKRIFMINKLRSASVHLVKFLFVLPLLAVMLLAFRSQQEVKKKEAKLLQQSAELALDTTPSGKNAPKFKQPRRITQFLKEHQAVKDVNWTRSNVITIILKNGKSESYNLNRKEEEDDFIEKYGSLLTLPPPPPPVPAAPKAPVQDEATASLEILRTEKSILDYLTEKAAADQQKASSQKAGEATFEQQKAIYEYQKAAYEKQKAVYEKEKAAYEKKYGAVPPSPPPARPPGYKVSDTLYVNAKITKPVDAIVPVVFSHELAPVVSDTLNVKIRVTKQVDTVIPVVYVIDDKIGTNINNTIRSVFRDTVIHINDGKQRVSVTSLNNFSGLIIVDGKETSRVDANKIDPSFIESITVLKGNNSVGVYGEKARDGVIIINTKQKALNRKLSNF